MATSESVRPNLYAETLASLPAEHQNIFSDFFRSTVTLAEISADFLVSTVAVAGSGLMCFFLHIGRLMPHPGRQASGISIIGGLLAVCLLHAEGAYRGNGSLLRVRDTERAIRVSVQALGILFFISVLAGVKLPYEAFAIAVVLFPILLTLEKHVFFSMLRRLHANGYGINRVVVYGAGEVGRRVVSALLGSPRLGLFPVGVIDDDFAATGACIVELGYRRSRTVPIYSGSITAALLKSLQCNLLIIPVQNLSADQRAAAARAAKFAGSKIAFLAPLQDRSAECIDIDGMVLTSPSNFFSRWRYAVAKRGLDILVSSTMLVLFAPVLFLIAVLVRLDSRGPALFVQKRVGRDGRIFDIFKFRSMYADTPRYDFSPIEPHDRRITRIGRFLRRTSLDELPQLINVLRGDMSLVGPRPEMPFIAEHYSLRQRRRLHVLPGITGLWQLSADRSFQIHENIHYDLYYIRNRTFFMDMSILIHTLFVAMHGV